MRTDIEIDDELLRQAMRSTGAQTKEGVVEAGLRLLVGITRSNRYTPASGQGAVAREP
jgi:Arc/MetJ family transcription regulator